MTSSVIGMADHDDSQCRVLTKEARYLCEGFRRFLEDLGAAGVEVDAVKSNSSAFEKILTHLFCVWVDDDQ